MAALTVQNIVDAGTKPTFGAASTSDTANIGSGSDTFLVYKNTDATTEAITLVVPGNTSYGQPMPDPVLTIASSTGELWIPLRKAYDDGTGNVTVTMASTTGITVALVRLG